jgi:hypothetical protein
VNEDYLHIKQIRAPDHERGRVADVTNGEAREYSGLDTPPGNVTVVERTTMKACSSAGCTAPNAGCLEPAASLPSRLPHFRLSRL